MPPKKTKTFPLRIANERGSTETIRGSIGHATPSLPSRIIPIERFSSRVLPEAEIDDNSDEECLIDNETDDRKADDEENDDVDPHAPYAGISFWQM
jgi:hypothetical protein